MRCWLALCWPFRLWYGYRHRGPDSSRGVFWRVRDRSHLDTALDRSGARWGRATKKAARHCCDQEGLHFTRARNSMSSPYPLATVSRARPLPARLIIWGRRVVRRRCIVIRIQGTAEQCSTENASDNSRTNPSATAAIHSVAVPAAACSRRGRRRSRQGQRRRQRDACEECFHRGAAGSCGAVSPALSPSPLHILSPTWQWPVTGIPRSC